MPTGGTKITLKLQLPNGTTKTVVWHATGAIDETTKPGWKLFTGYEDGEASSTAGAVKLHIENTEHYTVLSQKHEAE